MSRKTNKLAKKIEESELKRLAAVLFKEGILVRREELSRGNSFRTRSGHCTLKGQNLLFVDKRLPLLQQVSLLSDQVKDLGLEIKRD